MPVYGYIIIAFVLIALNAFFVLAEFAIVKIRPTQIAAQAAKGDKAARRIQRILANLDEYLSVSQVGITLTSIGLGFVGEPGFAALLHPLLGWSGISESLVEAIAITLGFVIVSYLHIVLGELVPKSVAIRVTERAVYLIALPIVFFRWVFIAPIWVLNHTVNMLLKPFKLNAGGGHSSHSEDEIRVILGKAEESGITSFRRLLYLENVLDLGKLQVRNAMHVRSTLQALPAEAPLASCKDILLCYKYSRYPVVGTNPDQALGYVHVKDLLFAGLAADHGVPAIAPGLIRPALKARDADPLEQLLGTMQRTGNHVAFVYDAADRWLGMVTLEDALEEVVGTIEEEYPVDPPLTLSGYLRPEQIFLDVAGATVVEAIHNTLRQVDPKALPLPLGAIQAKIMERERLGGSFVGHHLAIPHGRLDTIASPMVVVGRLAEAIPVGDAVVQQPGGDSVKLLIILLTPANTPRIHQVLLSHIAHMYESDFLEDRLYEAETPQELIDIIATAEQVVLT